MQRGWIHARTVAIQCEVSLAYGLTPSDFEAIGLSKAEMDDPEGMVTGKAAYAHLEQVYHRGQFEAFVIDVAQASGGVTPGMG